MKEFFIILIMKKYRINLTVEDYFDYVGTRSFKSVKDRMLFSLPEKFKKGYNIKFKKFKKFHSGHDFYRVHLSLITTETEIKQVLDWHKNASFRLDNVSYKLIIKHF